MQASDYFRQIYRRSGYYEAGKAHNVSGLSSNVNTANRGNDRQALPVNDGTVGEGEQNFMLIGPHGQPAPGGYWPFML